MSKSRPPRFIIAEAAAGDVDEVRALFVAYQRELNVDLCFQGFDEELRGLPGKYVPPQGCLLLARLSPGAAAQAVAGVVGMRPLSPGICEMKRLFVCAGWRGHGLGRSLAEAAIGAACVAGYAQMRLDTLEHMTQARSLYHALGFAEIDPYYANPLPGVRYLELSLTPDHRKWDALGPRSLTED